MMIKQDRNYRELKMGMKQCEGRLTWRLPRSMLVAVLGVLEEVKPIRLKVSFCSGVV